MNQVPANESWDEMTARHQREKIALAAPFALQGMDMTQAARKLGTTKSALSTYFARANTPWPKPKKGSIQLAPLIARSIFDLMKSDGRPRTLDDICHRLPEVDRAIIRLQLSWLTLHGHLRSTASAAKTIWELPSGGER